MNFGVPIKPLCQIAVSCATVTTIVSLASCGGGSSGGIDNSAGVGNSINRAPTISGDPLATVSINQAYTFAPQASDPDGDALTFSIQNKPGWTNFNGNSGELSGLPVLADVGSFDNIVISVSDGEFTTNLAGFGIAVSQIGVSSTTLSWSAPTRNNDGSALTDLAGYVLYYGLSSGNYTNEIRLDNPGITAYVVDGLTPATYYFSAKSVNSAGVESNFSAEAVKDLTGS